MINITFGCILIVIVMFDIIRTTLTTKGEGLISGIVSGFFRTIRRLAIRGGHRTSEVMGSASILALGVVWLTGLWAGWVLVFLGIPDAIQHSDDSTVDIYDLIYFVGFTLSTLGIGDITPSGALPRMATALASFNGLLIITLIVTYALSVVSAVVARRVLAHRIYLTGGDDGELLSEFSDINDFTGWISEIKKDLVSCTEQRLAYPILDNFVSKEEAFSLDTQLARLGVECHRKIQNNGVNERLKREAKELFSVLYRYTSLTGITDDDLIVRLKKLGNRDGCSFNTT